MRLGPPHRRETAMPRGSGQEKAAGRRQGAYPAGEEATMGQTLHHTDDFRKARELDNPGYLLDTDTAETRPLWNRRSIDAFV